MPTFIEKFEVLKQFVIQAVLLLALSAVGMTQTKDTPIVLVIHGGAGTIDPKTITPEQEAQYRNSLTVAVLAGYDILKNGGTSLDAVEKAVFILEDDSLFNAGRGSVFTHEGTIEMDAAIMQGNGKAGAVATVSGIKNPISAARAVMGKSPHVLLSGAGAEQFAREQHLEFRDNSYFETEFRRLNYHFSVFTMNELFIPVGSGLNTQALPDRYMFYLGMNYSINRHFELIPYYLINKQLNAINPSTAFIIGSRIDVTF